ncbi:MAG: hypothetical protein LBL58_13885 [Tannerellaceae bacterium]|jgi:hypothetical protein|nr:hypothetical protein [Tannerellaceae bacterium]
MEEKLNVILSSILECGYADIDFIVELEDRFVGFDWERVVSDRLYANDIIYDILSNAVYRACEELEIDTEEIENKMSVFCNFLDSHLYLTDKEGKTVQMYSLDDVREFLSLHYKSEEDR